MQARFPAEFYAWFDGVKPDNTITILGFKMQGYLGLKSSVIFLVVLKSLHTYTILPLFPLYGGSVESCLNCNLFWSL